MSIQYQITFNRFERKYCNELMRILAQIDLREREYELPRVLQDRYRLTHENKKYTACKVVKDRIEFVFDAIDYIEANAVLMDRRYNADFDLCLFTIQRILKCALSVIYEPTMRAKILAYASKLNLPLYPPMQNTYRNR